MGQTIYRLTDSGQVNGTEYYRSPHLGKWVVVDLDRGRGAPQIFDRLVLYSSELDGDETGLNNACCGCDLDATRGLWLVGYNNGDESWKPPAGVSVAWRSREVRP
jgi:hypothetical protein